MPTSGSVIHNIGSPVRLYPTAQDVHSVSHTSIREIMARRACYRLMVVVETPQGLEAFESPFGIY